MTGIPNAKRLLNEAMRKSIEKLKCDLSDLQDFTRGLDGDLLEALLTDNANTDAVANDCMGIDREVLDALMDFSGTVATFAAKYDAQRKALELG